jgi:hypothetical protein
LWEAIGKRLFRNHYGPKITSKNDVKTQWRREHLQLPDFSVPSSSFMGSTKMGRLIYKDRTIQILIIGLDAGIFPEFPHQHTKNFLHTPNFSTPYFYPPKFFSLFSWKNYYDV